MASILVFLNDDGLLRLMDAAADRSEKRDGKSLQFRLAFLTLKILIEDSPIE
jgi:hypothetical protein